jgi:hypothetical protein
MNKFQIIQVPSNRLSNKEFLNKTLPLILVLLIINLNPVFADDPACSYSYPKISELPHIKLTQDNNPFKSLWKEN